MSNWNDLWYGEWNPQPSKKAATILITAFGFASWFGLRIEFILSKSWERWGTFCAVLLALSTFRWFGRVCANFSGVELKHRASRISYSALAFVGAFFFSWALMVFTFPGMATRLSAAEAHVLAELTKDRQFGRNSCRFRVNGEYARRQLAGYICISESEYEKLPENGPMLVREKQSFFGSYVEGVDPMSANNAFQRTLEDSRR